MNGHYTTEDGIHLTAFKEGLVKALKEYSKKKFRVANVCKGIIAAISIRMQYPTFSHKIRTKLDSPEIHAKLMAEIKKQAKTLFHKHSAEADKLIAKVKAMSKPTIVS